MAKFIVDGTQAADLVKNKTVREAVLYAGDAESNKSVKAPVVRSSEKFGAATEHWKNSEGHYALWNEIHEMQSKFANAATPPTPAELAVFYPKLLSTLCVSQTSLLISSRFLQRLLTVQTFLKFQTSATISRL